MKNLTCLKQSDCSSDNNCLDAIITCKPGEGCFSVVGFQGANISTPVIRIAGCFPDPICVKANSSICVARYEVEHPFIRDYYCCCTQSMCNKNFELEPLASKAEEIGSNSIQMNITGRLLA